jgi:lipopolysaccharide biosynthesis regulator YciM
VSKKKFTNGLESIFTDTGKEDTYLGENSAFMTDEYQEEEEEVKVVPVARRASAKNFTSNLNSMLDNSMATSFESFIEEASGTTSSKASHFKKPLLKPTVTGLDALIRQTIGDINDEHTNLKKRITVILDQMTIEKLRSIAKNESAYVKDVIENVIDQYVKNYEIRRG